MTKLPLLIATAALAFVAETAIGQAGAPVDVRAVMQQQVNPAMLAIWDVGNNAMNDDGGIDPAKLDAAKWQTLANEAAKLAAAGHAMAGGSALQASAAGNAGVGDGEVPLAQVQAHLDADPAAFRAAGAAFAEHAEKLAAAAAARDAATAGGVIADMDAVCESCHSQFWYPEE